MEQNFTIAISKPCSEKFNEFKTTESGGFCGSCQKQVSDFRNMSDEKLIEYFKNREGNTCGYFKESQLKEYNQLEEPRKNTSFKYLKIVGLAFISALSLQNIQAQESKPDFEVVEKSINAKSDQVLKQNVQDGLLTGTVSDESGPLPGANIVLKGTNIGTSTNFDGEFIFPKALKKDDILIVSYIGYATQEFKIKENQLSIKLEMKQDTICMLGEVDVNEVYKSKRNLWQKIKGIF